MKRIMNNQTFPIGLLGIYYGIRNTKKCKTNPIHLQESRIKNMQNEPKSEAYAEPKAKSRRAGEPNYNLPINSFTHILIHFFMQNEPNLNISATKNCLDIASCLLYLLQLFTRQMQNFQKITKKTRILQLLDNNPLNSMYNKDLHKYFTPKYKFTHQPIYSYTHSLFYPKQTQFQNFEHRVSSIKNRKYAKRTKSQKKRLLPHLAQRATGDESRTKMQNEPNLETNPSWPTSSNDSRATAHERRINIQNEPNYNSANRKLEIENRKSPWVTSDE